MKAVKILKPFRVYVVGDIVGLPDRIADGLIKQGAARLYKPKKKVTNGRDNHRKK